MQQLDIFNDSRDRVLVNTLAEAIVQGSVTRARSAADALRAEFPNDQHLAPALVLIEALAAETIAGTQPLADLTAAQAARQALEDAVQAAAQALLGGTEATPWLAARWCALAHRAGALPFEPLYAQSHAAALFAAARAWPQMAEAALGIASWRRKPQPLDWVAQARWHLQGPDAWLPLAAELAWLAPQKLPPLLARVGDARLHKQQHRFEAFDADDNPASAWVWWPAWLLVDQPLLAAPLDGAQTDGAAPPERCFKVLQSLLRLERQGRHHDIVALRRELQGLHAALFAAYMATR